MYELIQAGEKTYYINCPAKMGRYRLKDSEVCLIDSGNDKDAGKKVLKILEAGGWKLKMVINTHSHADHIGGNSLLAQRTGCPVYTAGPDLAFTQYPVLEPSFLYGGYPFKELRNKFLMAQPSGALPLTPEVLPEGLEMMAVNGHSFSMSAIKTDDGVWFLADCLTGENILEKYHVSFLYDVQEYLNSLEKLKTLEGRLYIPAHAEPVEDIRPLAEANRKKILEIAGIIKEICTKPRGFEEILKAVFEHYGLVMDYNQYVLVGSTVRSYLSWLHDRGEAAAEIADNRLVWCSVNGGTSDGGAI